ncbi:thioredoxin domain-containing protein [Mucilaginibacter sp. RS28]|uniref:Thioredoxin domain-containing protein n=1 Tax=Mucilaginibacter straminoryzae TaxID=2932774 RepID=A0A9X1X273_9SPHI|nr:thioredoxin domain-containing protein [Mucilaginibacter straminoryzae]MCJ8208213.1 thioredoxin domain-containing protein [Mucilaginibacter straminoryzae]
MKKLLSLIALVLVAGCIFAQEKNIENLPTYHILNTDSVKVTTANLKKNKPVMIIYFSPDCSHCQHLMYEMKPQLNELKDVQIVMITFVQYKMIKDFYNSFGLNAYPNITVGTEGYTYEMQKYFDVKTTPYIAIYNKHGKLVKAYEKAPPVKELIKTAKSA